MGRERGEDGSEEAPIESESQAVISRLQELRRRARGFPARQQELLDEALEQLAVALQAIKQAEEELQRQNQELSVAHTLLDAERRRYHELFDFAPEAYLVTDPEGNIEEVNRAASAMLGWRPRALLGKPLADYVDPDEREGFRTQILQLSTKRRRLQDWVLKLRTASGEPADVSITVDAVRESDRRVASLRWLIRTATPQAERMVELLTRARAARTESETATARLRKLQAITDVMLRHAGLEELLRGLLDAVRQALETDTATILLVTPDGKNLAVRAASGEDEDVRGQVRVPLGKGIAGRIASQRRPRIVNDVPAAGPYSQALRSRVKSLAGVPLTIGDRVTGVVHAATFTPHTFGEEDVHLLELVAERAAVAIENAALYDSEQEARRLAEEASARMAALQSITGALSQAATSDEVADVVMGPAVAALGAEAGLMAVVTDDGRSLEIVRTAGYPQDLVEKWRRFPLDAPLPLSEAVRTGRPVLLGSTPAREERYPTLTAMLDLPDHAMAAIPMSGAGPAPGGLVFRFAEPRAFPAPEVEFMKALGHEAGLALERARLFEAERHARRATELSQLRLAFLAEAGTILSGSLQIPDALENLARLSVTFLTDLCLIDLRQPDGSIRRMASVHADGEKQPLADLLLTRFPPDPSGPHPAVRVIQTGRSEFAAEMPEEFLRRTTRDQEHYEIVRALGFQSFMCVPLVARGGTRGCFTLVSCNPGRRYGPADVALAEELARRAAVAMDNAELYEAALRARHEAELATDRTAALQSVTAALAEALTPAEVAEVIVERGLAALAATAGSIVLLSPDRSELVLVRSFGYPEEVLEPWRRFAIESEAPVAESARSGEPVFLGSPDEAERRFPGILGRSPAQAWACIPLVVEGRTIGAMGLSFAERRAFPDEERTFMLALGRQCAQALERARLYEAERSARGEAERAEDRLAFLAEASQVLSSSLDIDITLLSIARLAVPRLADWCTIDLLDDEGSIRQLAVSHRDPSKEPLARELRTRYPPEQDPPHPIWRVMLSGQSELASEITDRDLVARAKDAMHVKMLRQLGIRSHIVAPLQARGRILGAISFICGESGRTYGQEDLILAEDLGRRAAVAIDNSGLYRAELTARREAERAGVRLAFLSEATASLSSEVPDYQAMLERVARLAVPALADICVIDIVAEDGRIQRVAATHADPEKEELVEQIRQHPPDPARPHPVLSVLATGEPRIIADVPQEMSESIAQDEELKALRALDATSVMIFPLRARDRTLGAITLVATSSRQRYDEDDTGLAHELARRAALVVDNARLYDLQRNIAQTLQRSLLPASLPDIPGMEMAAQYRAAGEGNEVGGDFYDAFEVDGTWILAVGDVCGKGPEAAAVTGLARHTLRAVALHEPRPSRILATLNEAILRALGDQRFCTVCCLRVRPHPGGARLTVCSAGHPLPLVLRANGDLEAAGRPSMLLGVLPEIELADDAFDVGPGDAVVLYTDGVIEDRGGDELGSHGLVRVLRENAGSDAAALAEAVERAVVEHSGESLRDDIAVLVLRVDPSTR